MPKRFLNSLLVFAFAGLLILSAVTWAPKILSVSSTVGTRELPIYCVETQKPQISISFDAAWGNEDTQTILDILASHQVKATFFMTGGWVESFPDDVKKIYEAGHDLGNHSESHQYMTKLSDEEKTQELMTVHNKVKELTGYEMFLFRPPYGDYNNEVVTNARKNGYYPIQWDVDSLDWKNISPEDMIRRAGDVQSGDIILFHNDSQYLLDALPTLLKSYQEKGLKMVKVSEILLEGETTIDVQGKQHPTAVQDTSKER